MLGEYFGYNPLDPATKNRLTYLRMLCSSVSNVLGDMDARHVYDENGEKVTAERLIRNVGTTALWEISYAYSRATDEQKEEIALTLVKGPKVKDVKDLKTKVLGGISRFAIGAVEQPDGNYHIEAVLSPAEFAYLKARAGESIEFSFILPSQKHA
jgi:hypothetical protein